jgi:anti-sigma28 factor (negative regulator of flagellin synthesis)
MCVGMALTIGTRRGPRSANLVASSSEGDVGRAARVEELRQMVASGRYQVQPQKLALKILVRALKRR